MNASLSKQPNQCLIQSEFSNTAESPKAVVRCFWTRAYLVAGGLETRGVTVSELSQLRPVELNFQASTDASTAYVHRRIGHLPMAIHPDLIVLDLAMPHIDGWAAAERLRRSPVTRGIPIIALTAIPGARESARLSGCDAFMAKPCLPQMLWCEVRLLLGLEDTSTSPADEDEEQGPVH